MALTQIQQAMLADGILTADAAGRLKMADGFVNAAKLGAGAARTNFGAGAVLQVVTAQKTDPFTTTTNSYVDVPGLSATITPQNTSSKILVLVGMHLSHIDSDTGFIQLLRNSTQIAMGDALGSFTRCLFQCRIAGGTGGASDSYMTNSYHQNWLDSPASASAVTYKLQAWARAGTYFAINRSGYQTLSDPNMGATTSSITLMEIAG